MSDKFKSSEWVTPVPLMTQLSNIVSERLTSYCLPCG